MRSKFMEETDFLSESYNGTSDEIYVQCTVEQRTKDSAVSQLQGLFNTTLTYPAPDTTYNINQLDFDSDLLLHVNDNCQRFTSI